MLKSQAALAALKSAPARRRYNGASPGERVLGSMFPGRGVGWPGGWSQDRLSQVMHLKNWTFVAIDAIASLIGQLVPNVAYVSHSDPNSAPHSITEKRRGSDGASLTPFQHRKRAELSYSRYREVGFAGSRFGVPGYGHKALSVVKPHEELEPVEHDHPLRRLLENPNPFDTSFDLLYEIDLFLELCGTAYVWAVPNGWGVPCELWVIPSHWVWPRVGGSKGRYVNPNHPNADHLIEYYEIRPWGAMGSAGVLKFPPEEVLRFHWKSPLNKIDGYAKLTAAAEWIDTEESMGKSRWAQFMNQALPSLWLELPPEYEDPNDDRIARIEAKVQEKFAGEFNQGKVLITSAGVKAQPLSFSPEAMMYFEGGEQMRDMILAVFRVPGAAVGLVKDMTYGSILACLAQFAAFAINPRLTMLGLQLQKQLTPRFVRDRPIKIWWDDATPPNPEQVNADIQADFAAAAITTNEIRALRGRKPYAHGGDDPLVTGPGGLVPLPLNTGEDWTELGELVPTLGGEEEQQPGMGQAPGEEEEPGSNGLSVAEPNGAPSKRWVSKDDKERTRALEGFMASLSEEQQDGLYVWVNEGPPRLALVDFMDWWDGGIDLEKKVKSALSSWTGDEARVVSQNEGAKPSKDSGWVQVGQNFAKRFRWEKNGKPHPKAAELEKITRTSKSLAEALRRTAEVIGIDYKAPVLVDEGLWQTASKATTNGVH